MESLCESQFWDSEFWNSTDPYFTICFESTALSVSPFLFLVIFGITDVLNNLKSKFRRHSVLSSMTGVTCAKTLLTIGLIILQLSQIVRLVLNMEKTEFFLVDYLSPSLEALGYLISLSLMLMSQYHMVSSSGVQFFFWLGSALVHSILFRTAYTNFPNLDNEDGNLIKLGIVYLTRLIAFPIVLLRFLIECGNDGLWETRSIYNRLDKRNPEKRANFLSRTTLFWYDKLAWTGFRRTLTQDDLWDVSHKESSRVQVDTFTKYWNQEKLKASRRGKAHEAGIFLPIVKCAGFTYAVGLLLKVTADMLVFIYPLMLRLLVAHVSNPAMEPDWKGYLYVVVIGITSITQSMLNAQSNKRSQLSGMRLRAAISNAVFTKAFAIAKVSSVGEVVNLQCVDSNKLFDLLPMLNITVGGPFQIIVSIIFLYTTLGPSIFAGVGILILLVPLNMYIVSVSRRYQIQQMKLKDERVKLTSEVVHGIQVLKLHVWETAYLDQIEAIRQKEIHCLRKIASLAVISGFIFQCTPVFIALATFTTYVLSDSTNVLTAEKTFVSITLFNIMRIPMILLPMAFSTAMQASVSIKRLNAFFNLKELDQRAVTHNETHHTGFPVVLQNATLSWTAKSTTLRNISFSARQGELIAVVGVIGSGKSSFLSALLGELTKQYGIVNTVGSLAYVSQSAWIQNLTLRDNILFCDAFDDEKYSRVLQACALETDLQNMDDGDQTQIGERGKTLSGGQKQRVALARAAYKDASIYLLDDPLSAVDSQVGNAIFENLIGPRGMLSEKTRIFVTHAIRFLPHVDRIIVMKDGQISECGTYKELLNGQGEFAAFLMTQANVENGVVNVPNLVLDEHADQVNEVAVNAPRRVLIGEEVAVEGRIKIGVFLSYFKSAGIFISFLSLVFSATANGIIAFSNIWLSNWSTEATKDEKLNGTALADTTEKYLIGYGILGAAAGITTLISSASIAILTVEATRTLHSAALARVIRAPMSYFEHRPLGQLINRFSKDVDTLDNTIPTNLRTLLFMFYNVFFTFVVISYSTPFFLIMIIPMAILYLLLQRFYVATSRQLKRLEGITRSPIYSHFGETISGSTTIRAFGLQDAFINESEKRIDMNQKTNFPFIYSSIWISIRLEFMGFLIILCTCIFILQARGFLDAGHAGLAISYALQITSFLNSLARQMSDMEANIVSVERVGELKETPQERVLAQPDLGLSPDWPERGRIVFENFCLRYENRNELALNRISCVINSGEKVGVVGRTGAGKSSFALALFRIAEGADGRICIDEIDISSIALHDLRQRLSVIPQDPILFSGTLRFNLDPSGIHTDAQIWNALEISHLRRRVERLDGNLEYEIQEEGQNFCVGERQLICLARALLQTAKILVLDEATAAVDVETDELIQRTIRAEFANSTVISIAHRLNTIMDYNRVMVLDAGRMMEFDTPEALLNNHESMFRGMAQEAGLL